MRFSVLNCQVRCRGAEKQDEERWAFSEEILHGVNDLHEDG